MSFTRHSRVSGVQRSRVLVMAHVIFLLFTDARCARERLISTISRDRLATNETHEKKNFDDWYTIKPFIIVLNV